MARRGPRRTLGAAIVASRVGAHRPELLEALEGGVHGAEFGRQLRHRDRALRQGVEKRALSDGVGPGQERGISDELGHAVVHGADCRLAQAVRAPQRLLPDQGGDGGIGSAAEAGSESRGVGFAGPNGIEDVALGRGALGPLARHDEPATKAFGSHIRSGFSGSTFSALGSSHFAGRKRRSESESGATYSAAIHSARPGARGPNQGSSSTAMRSRTVATSLVPERPTT